MPLRLVHATPGTMLAEHAEHCQRRAKRIIGEWYDYPRQAA